MIRIIRVRYQGLWNSEYPLVANRVIDIAASYNPQSLHLQRSFDRLAAFRPQLAKIVVQEKADRDSARLSELDQTRDTDMNIIYAVSKAFKRAPIADISAHATRIQDVLHVHGFNMPAANYTAETKRMFDLTAECHDKPELMASLAALSLMPVFEQMESANREFDKIFMERNKRQSETERVDVRAIRYECDRAITSLWTSIEFCAEEYGDADYKPLAGAINNLNAYYKQQLAARATRRKAKQNISAEEPIKIPE